MFYSVLVFGFLVVVFYWLFSVVVFEGHFGGLFRRMFSLVIFSSCFRRWPGPVVGSLLVVFWGCFIIVVIIEGCKWLFLTIIFGGFFFFFAIGGHFYGSFWCFLVVLSGSGWSFSVIRFVYLVVVVSTGATCWLFLVIFGWLFFGGDASGGRIQWSFLFIVSSYPSVLISSGCS